MDQGTLSGLVIVVLMAVFLGIVVWTWSGKRTRDFSEAAQLPLEEDHGDVMAQAATEKGAHKK